jgi:Mor family transcriptional regulator
MNKETLEGVTFEDFEDSYKDIAEIVGMEKMFELCTRIGGAGFYLPTMDKLLMNFKTRKILEEFNGYNVKQLARKYEISERTCYRICNEK